MIIKKCHIMELTQINTRFQKIYQFLCIYRSKDQHLSLVVKHSMMCLV
jgi:hypothetical protein